MHADPDGDGKGLGRPLVPGDPLGLVLGELDGDLLGLALGDAFVLLTAGRGRVVPGTAAALVAAWPAPVDAPACGDGRAPGVVARAEVDAAGVGLA